MGKVKHACTPIGRLGFTIFTQFRKAFLSNKEVNTTGLDSCNKCKQYNNKLSKLPYPFEKQKQMLTHEQNKKKRSIT